MMRNIHTVMLATDFPGRGQKRGRLVQKGTTMRNARKSWWLGVTLAAALAPAHGAEFTVPDGDVPALVAAFSSVTDNDIIVLATNGTYTFTNPNNNSNGGNALPRVLNQLTLRGNGSIFVRTAEPDVPFRFLLVDDDKGGTGDLTVENLTFTNGLSGGGNGGGAVQNSGGTLTVLSCRFVGNNSPGGGAILSFNGNLTVRDSLVTANSSDDDGGGIEVGGSIGFLVMSNCTVSGNMAGFRGGGMFLGAEGGSIQLLNSTLNGNTAQDAGGGVASQMPLTVFGCTISSNSLTADGGLGGGLSHIANFASIVNSTVSGNQSRGGGGGIYLQQPDGSMVLSNVTVVQNLADSDGTLAQLDFQNGGGVLVVNPPARPAGKDVAAAGTPYFLQLVNTLIADNQDLTTGPSALDFPDLAGDGPVNMVSDDYNLIGATNGAPITPQPNDQFGSVAAPLDPLIGPLQNNGGPTLTHALLNASPANNAGDPALQNLPLFDQRGPGFPRVSGSAVDIGAFEGQLLLQTITFTQTNKTYGDGPFAFVAEASSSLPVSFTYVSGPVIVAGSKVNINGAGTVVIRANQAGNDTYAAAPEVEVTFEILPAPLTVTANNQSRKYGEANPPLTITYTGFVYGETNDVLDVQPAITTTAAALSSVGNYPIPVFGASDVNYSLSYVTGQLSVISAPLEARADNKFRGYGAGNPPLTFTYTGFVNGETNDVLDLPPTAATAATSTSPVGSYPIEVTEANDNNYSLTVLGGTLTVTQVVLTVTANNTNRVYGQANPPLTGNLVGLMNNDAITANFVSPASPGSPLGGYPIVPALNDPNGRLGNYTITTNSGILTVTAAALAISANNTNRLYGRPNPAFTGSVIGLAAGDSITATFNSIATPTSPVGNYILFSPTIADPGNRLGNYLVTTNLGTLTVNPAPLTVTANSTSRIFGTPNPTFTGTITGIQNEENITATYSSPATVDSLPGPYDIIPAVAGSLANYTVTTNLGVLTVVPGTLPFTVGGINLSNQTGLYVQRVVVSNPFPVTITAVRLVITNWSAIINNISDARVYNASGQTNGLPYVQAQSENLLPPGGTVTFVLEYFVSSRRTLNPAPAFTAEVVTAAPFSNPTGTAQDVDRFFFLPGGSFLVEFETVTSRIYYVQYSSSAAGPWKTAQPFIVGNGTQVQWIDSGPPKTESPPAGAASRFYRVLWQPRQP